MTRRGRLEAKLEKRREWAVKREADAAARFNASHAIVGQIPMGQPILVGHHSEKRHRAALARSDAHMRAGCESADMAKHHEQKADGIERQLDGSIFSDDPDAIESLEAKVAELEAQRDRMKAINAAIRKEGGLATLSPMLTEAEQAELASLAKCWGNVYKPGFPPYALSNLGGRIRAAKERIAVIKARKERTEQAEAAPGGVLIQGTDYIRVTFAEKPDRSVLNDLKAAGFRWNGGGWYGRRESLPASVQAT